MQPGNQSLREPKGYSQASFNGDRVLSLCGQGKVYIYTYLQHNRDRHNEVRYLKYIPSIRLSVSESVICLFPDLSNLTTAFCETWQSESSRVKWRTFNNVIAQWPRVLPGLHRNWSTKALSSYYYHRSSLILPKEYFCNIYNHTRNHIDLCKWWNSRVIFCIPIVINYFIFCLFCY